MPYIPKEHEKYDLLPLLREKGGEAFDYPGKLIYEAELLSDSLRSLIPYNFDSYETYFARLDYLIGANSGNPEIVGKLVKIRETVWRMNQKEEWSILRYIGPTTDDLFGLTNGKNYYWPTRKDHPVYQGVIDDEEFTSYMYPTEATLWEIIEDPTGMAFRTIYEKAEDHYSQAAYDDYMEQIRKQFGDAEVQNENKTI